MVPGFSQIAAAVLLVGAAAEPPSSVAAWSLALEDPALRALIQESIERNPSVAAARALTESASRRPLQAQALADPALSLGYTNDGWKPTLGSMPDTSLSVMLSQEFPYPGKRRLRGEIAQKEEAITAESEKRVVRSLVAAVHRGYLGLILSRTLLSIIGEQSAAWTQIEAVVRSRYAVGQGGLQDLLRVRTELARIEQLRAEQEAEELARLTELNALRDRNAETPVASTATLRLRKIDATRDDFLAWARAAAPEARASEIAASGAALEVELASLDARPDFAVQSAYMNRAGLAPMWQVAVGVSLPLRRGRIEARRAEARALLDARRASSKAVGLEVAARTGARVAQREVAARLARIYEEGIVPQGRLSVEAALASYQTGKSPFVSVLEAVVTLYGDLAAHARVLERHEQLLVSLEEADLGEGAASPPMPASAAQRGAASDGSMGMR